MEHFLCAGFYVVPAQGFSLEILPTARGINYYYHHHFIEKRTEVLETPKVNWLVSSGEAQI